MVKVVNSLSEGQKRARVCLLRVMGNGPKQILRTLQSEGIIVTRGFVEYWSSPARVEKFMSGKGLVEGQKNSGRPRILDSKQKLEKVYSVMERDEMTPHRAANILQ